MLSRACLRTGKRGRRILPVLVLAVIGLPAAAEKTQGQAPIVFRMFLFQGLRAEGRPGLKEADIFPVSSRPETAGIKRQIKGSENALSAVAIETLFEFYKLQAVDELFFHEAGWNRKEPADDLIMGPASSYRIRLDVRPTAADRFAVRALISKSKTQASTGRPYREAVLFDRELDLIIGEPVLAAMPHPEGDLFVFLWAAVGAPGERKNSVPDREPVYFVTPPQVRNQVRPSFPEELRQRNLGGRIGLKLTIDGKGNVSRVEVEKPLHAYLNYSAVQAFRQWTFDPVLIKGKPVMAAFRLDYEFNPWLYTREEAWAVEPPSGAAAAPPGELAGILAQAAVYCRKLAEVVSGYVCEESIQETHYDLLNSRRWRVLAVSRRSDLSVDEEETEATLSTKDRINQGQIADIQTGAGRILFRKFFQFFDPQRDKRRTYLCDYQIFKKAGVVEEHRKILKENGKKPSDPKRILQDRRFSALGSFFAPLRVLARDRQPQFLYWLAGEEKIGGRKARILMMAPKSGDRDGIWSARVWLDKTTLQVLKCEVDGLPFDGQEDILNECAGLNIQPQFLMSHEYKPEKDGVLFPWRSEILAAYPGIDPRGPSPRLKIFMTYEKYKFFSVATESEIIR